MGSTDCPPTSANCIGVSVHQEHFPIVEIRQHAFTVDAKIEHHEPDQEKDERGKQECLDDLSYRPARLMLGARRRLGALLYEDGICRSVWVQGRCEIAFWCHRCLEALATRVAPAQQEERGGLPRSWRRNRILLAGVRLDLVGANLGALSRTEHCRTHRRASPKRPRGCQSHRLIPA